MKVKKKNIVFMMLKAQLAFNIAQFLFKSTANGC